MSSPSASVAEWQDDDNDDDDDDNDDDNDDAVFGMSLNLSRVIV